MIRKHLDIFQTEWRKRVEGEGLVYHTLANGDTYWKERTYYEFTPNQVDKLEETTLELWDRSLDAAAHIIANKRYEELAIPEKAIPYIEAAWELEPPAVYGRFDLMWDGKSEPKLLEFNADTPTSLIEAAVCQWSWKETYFPEADQFNSLHDKLVAKWKELIDGHYVHDVIHVAHANDESCEDLATATYMRDVIELAGAKTKGLLMEQITLNPDNHFVDLDGEYIKSIFKLYPWEWMLNEEFAEDLRYTMNITQKPVAKSTQWIEPIWKMLLSNKGVLAVMHELFPHHPNLLAAHLDKEPAYLPAWVRKPLLSREGANISVGGISTPGSYGGPYVWQQHSVQNQCFGEARPIIGSWVVDGAPAGIGIREGCASVNGGVTGNLSGFVPHIFR